MDSRKRRPEYREFCGSVVEQMPRCRSALRMPLNVQQALELGLTGRRYWHERWVDTADGVAYHPDGRCKIVLQVPSLLALTPQHPLRRGALVIDEDTYETMPGLEFGHDRAGWNRRLTEREALAHEGLGYLLRGEQERFVPALFAIGRQYGHERLMACTLAAAPPETPVLRNWYVAGARAAFDVYGNTDLDLTIGRILGKAQHAPLIRS